jgi:hypothetical protein
MTQDARGRRTHPSRGGLSYSEPSAQHSSPTKMRQEFIIGEREQVGLFAKKNRWRVGELASWLKPDGTVIHYLRFPETVADLEEGSIVHVLGVDAIIGLPPRIASRLKIVSHGLTPWPGVKTPFKKAPVTAGAFFQSHRLRPGEPGFAPRYMVPARMTTTMVAASIIQLMPGLLARMSQLSMGPVRLARLSQELSESRNLSGMFSLPRLEGEPTAHCRGSLVNAYGQLDEEPDGYRPVDQRERGNPAWLGFAAPLSQSA